MGYRNSVFGSLLRRTPVMGLTALVGCTDLASAPPPRDGGAALARFPGDPQVGAAVVDALRFAAERVDATVRALERRYPSSAPTRYPTATDASGQWLVATSSDWRSGFFPGVLWQLYERTRDPLWLARARGWTAAIEPMKDRPIDHDLGFRFCLSYGNGHRLSDSKAESDRAYRDAARAVLLQAAATLDRRFDMGGVPVGALRSEDDYPPGSRYPVYIDSMMNLCLLFSAWELSGAPPSGPARAWFEHALTQARTTLSRHLRADASTYHIVEHNDGSGGGAADGAVYRKSTDQGFAPESTWSRGQAWALYGFAQAYRFARADARADAAELLGASRRTAAYFLDHLPDRFPADPYNHAAGDLVPPSDFNAALGEPAGPYGTRRAGLKARTGRDSSAAAVAAAGLLWLAQLSPERDEQARAFQAGEDILRSLLTFRGADGALAYLAKSSVHQGVLAAGAVAFGSAPQSLSYGDYYALEAMNLYLSLTTPPP